MPFWKGSAIISGGSLNPREKSENIRGHKICCRWSAGAVDMSDPFRYNWKKDRDSGKLPEYRHGRCTIVAAKGLGFIDSISKAKKLVKITRLNS